MTAIGTEANVILGLGICAAIFAYYSFEFAQTEELYGKVVGNLFFALSMLFVLLIVNALYLIGMNTGLSYLQEGITGQALQVFYYAIIVGMAIYFIYIFVMIFKLMLDSMKSAFGKRGKGGVA